MERVKQLFDVCIMQSQKDKHSRHLSTPFWNLPYPLARAKAKQEIAKFPRGCYYVIVPNGQKPVQQLKLNV